ncbi:hypothetical protein H4582DRAFT_2062858 [Lactarius indigo]|nr:hypothetical protein H4582DRAFT_2062858 [Lactarius indigo]
MSFTSMEVPYEDPAIYVHHGLIHSPDHASESAILYRSSELKYLEERKANLAARSHECSVKECETIAAAKVERGVESNEKRRAVESSLPWPRVWLGLRAPGARRLLARPGVEQRQILGILRTVLPGVIYMRVLSSGSVGEAEREAETVQLPRFGKHVDKALFSGGVNSQMSHFSTSMQETCSMCSFVCAGEIHGKCWRPEDGQQIVVGADLADFSCVFCGPTVTRSRSVKKEKIAERPIVISGEIHSQLLSFSSHLSNIQSNYDYKRATWDLRWRSELHPRQRCHWGAAGASGCAVCAVLILIGLVACAAQSACVGPPAVMAVVVHIGLYKGDDVAALGRPGCLLWGKNKIGVDKVAVLNVDLK